MEWIVSREVGWLNGILAICCAGNGYDHRVQLALLGNYDLGGHQNAAKIRFVDFSCALKACRRLTSVDDLKPSYTLYAESACVGTTKLNMVCCCHDAIVIGEEPIRFVLNCSPQPCVDTISTSDP